MSVLEVRDLHVRFRTRTGPVDAVRGLTCALAPGEVVAMTGPSGAGKSAAALALLRLLPPTATVSGQVRLTGPSGSVDLLALPRRCLPAVRGRRVAMVFQDAAASLDPVRTAIAQVAEAVRAHPLAGRPVGRRAARQAAADALDRAGLLPGRYAAYPHELSGGMRQRVMIAMAVVHRPEVIVADEPTTGLDPGTADRVLRLLLSMRDEVGAALLLITHDRAVADAGDRVLRLRAGRLS